LTAFRTAQADRRVAGLILLTALLQDPSTVPAGVIAEATDRRVARSYVALKATQAATWRKILRGRANYRRALETVGRLLKRRAVVAAADPGTTRVIEALQALVTRGVSVHFVFAEPTTVLEYFRMTIQRFVPMLRAHGTVDVTILRGADHTFTELRDQARVINLMTDWVKRCVSH
jgi:hypothetical protein